MEKFVVFELKTHTETVNGEEVTKETASQVGHSVVDETEARERAEAAARRNPSGVYAVAKVVGTVSIPVAWGG